MASGRVACRFSRPFLKPKKTREKSPNHVDLTFYGRFWGCHLSERGSSRIAAGGGASLARLAKTRAVKVKSNGRSPGPPVSFAWLGGAGDGRSRSGDEGGERLGIASAIAPAISDGCRSAAAGAAAGSPLRVR